MRHALDERYDRQPVEAAKCNLGSGEDYRKGDWVNVDYNDRYDPDVVHDLNDQWPFADNSFTLVVANHIFEHLDDPFFQFKEAQRVLQPGGTLRVTVPLGINAATDMTHKHEWTYDSPLQFAANWEQLCRPGDYQFDPPTDLRLVGRDCELTAHRPFGFLGPLGSRLLDAYPGVWVSDWPFSSAELTATYRLPEVRR